MIAGGGSCRYPEQARTSMSGYGVNVGELIKFAGWSTIFSRKYLNEQNHSPGWPDLCFLVDREAFI